MPVERRSLRSNSKSDTSSSTNGEKTRSTSQQNAKDKAAPTTRAAANKAKTAPTKKAAPGKGTTGNNHDEQPHVNGTEPVENGVNGAEDVEMGEDENAAGGPTSATPTNNKELEGDKMTVVVPPSKGSRLAADSGADKEGGDVAMEGADDENVDDKEPEIDPKVKAVQGKPFLCDRTNYHHLRYRRLGGL